MGLAQSPRVATNGLVLYYDQDNIKSYSGPAIQNLAKTLSSNYGAVPSTATGRSYSGGLENVIIPQLGPTTSAFTDIQNNYNLFTPNSADCCPSPHVYGTNIVVEPSTLYTYAIVYRVTSEYTNANYMYRYEHTAIPGPDTYVTEAGVHNASNRIHLGDGWYWAWATFTTTPTTNILSYVASFYYRYSNASDRLSIARVLIVKGDYTGLHPRFWPAVNTTRTASQSFADLTSRCIFSAASLTYANTGAISFDGTNNYLRLDNNTALDVQTPSVEVWVKTDNLNQNGFFFEKGIVNSQYSLFQEGTSVRWRQRLTDTTLTNLSFTTASFMSTSSWAHIVGTYTSGDRRLYVNGSLVASDTQAGTIAVNSGGMYIGEYGGGSYRYDGSIGVVKVYNRVLTPQEITQNFNALRGRYGV
jgi:hypothetical protein